MNIYMLNTVKGDFRLNFTYRLLRLTWQMLQQPLIQRYYYKHCLLLQAVTTYLFSAAWGKAAFLQCFFLHAEFTPGESQQGSLSDTLLDNDVHKQGFLAFLRLIGTVYFKKHATAFESNSPESHFKSFITSSTDFEEQHINWLEDIHQNTWDRITFEVSSTEALWRHWKRSC